MAVLPHHRLVPGTSLLYIRFVHRRTTLTGGFIPKVLRHCVTRRYFPRGSQHQGPVKLVPRGRWSFRLIYEGHGERDPLGQERSTPTGRNGRTRMRWSAKAPQQRYKADSSPGRSSRPRTFRLVYFVPYIWSGVHFVPVISLSG